MFDKDNAEKMFGYRIKYLGPEDDENEDMCFAYRHVPSPDSKPPQNQDENEERGLHYLGSPTSSQSANLPFKSPFLRKAHKIKLIYLNEVANVTNKYLQLRHYQTLRIKRLPVED
jgi:hypothetical protein